jgi:hypothetical protein
MILIMVDDPSNITREIPPSNAHKDRHRLSIFSGIAAVALPGLVYIGIILSGYDGLPYLRGDCQYYYFTAISLWHDGDLDLSNQLTSPLVRHSGDVSLDHEGRLVPKHPIWFSLAALPLIAALGPSGALVFNVCQLVLLLYLTYRLAVRFARPPAASLAVVVTGTVSFLPHYVWNFSPDIFVTLMLIAGLVSLPADRSPARMRCFAAGMFFGLAAVTKYPLFLALLGIPLLLGRPYRKTLSAFAAGLALPLVVWACLNVHLFGSPFVTPYDRIAEIGDGVTTVRSQRSDFDVPMWTGIREQLFESKRGLLFSTPITLLALLGLPLMVERHRRTALYLGGTSLLIFLLFSKYQWWRASTHGNRFLLPIVVLAAVPLGVLIDWTIQRFRKGSFTGAKEPNPISPDPPPVREQGHE